MQIRNRTILFAIVIALLVIDKTTAQTFVWAVPPSDYTDIKRISKDLYQVTSDGKFGVIRPDGTILVEAVCSEITPFYENHALLLVHEGEKNRVIGNLTISGICNLYSKPYYTLLGQDFFSDGLLSVENDEGTKGYIDERGNEVVGFLESYDNIKPFSEGYASIISKNKKYSLIDKSGNKMPMIIGIGEIKGGTNVYQGQAYVWDTDGKYYVYDTAKRICKKTKKPNSTQIDYLYCFSEITQRSGRIKYNQLEIGTAGLAPVVADGKYGFKFGEKYLLPPQFSYASIVEDNYAIVRINGKMGILKYIDNPSYFSTSIPKSEISFSPGKSVDCVFSVDEPEIWKEIPYHISLRDAATQETIDIKRDGNNYFFSYIPKSKQGSFVVDVTSEGMTVTSDTILYSFIQKKLNLQITISVDESADRNGKVWVMATVSNPNTESISTTIVMSGGTSKFAEISKNVTINSGSSITLKSFFYDVNKEETNQFVKVSASNGNIMTRNHIRIKPFARRIFL